MIYANSAGTNVTLSPRMGVGEVEPKQGSAADVTLLPGSGISNGMMIANVKCTYLLKSSARYLKLLIDVEAQTATVGAEDP